MNSEPQLACLHDQTKVAFLEGRFFLANQGFLKTFQIVLIGWIKAGLPAALGGVTIIKNLGEAL